MKRISVQITEGSKCFLHCAASHIGFPVSTDHISAHSNLEIKSSPCLEFASIYIWSSVAILHQIWNSVTWFEEMADIDNIMSILREWYRERKLVSKHQIALAGSFVYCGSLWLTVVYFEVSPSCFRLRSRKIPFKTKLPISSIRLFHLFRFLLFGFFKREFLNRQI